VVCPYQELPEVSVNADDSARGEPVCVPVGDDVTDADFRGVHAKNFQAVTIAQQRQHGFAMKKYRL